MAYSANLLKQLNFSENIRLIKAFEDTYHESLETNNDHSNCIDLKIIKTQTTRPIEHL